MITTRTATIDLDPRGFVFAHINRGAAQSLDEARENLAGTIEACGGVRRPLLVDVTMCLPLEPEVRHYYTGEILVESFLALGMLIEASPFGAMMGNVYLRIARPGIPTRLFTQYDSAVTWLLQSFVPPLRSGKAPRT